MSNLSLYPLALPDSCVRRAGLHRSCIVAREASVEIRRLRCWRCQLDATGALRSLLMAVVERHHFFGDVGQTILDREVP
jgi:hypothetical protein